MLLGCDAIYKNQCMQSGYAVGQVERRGAQICDLDVAVYTLPMPPIRTFRFIELITSG